MSENLPSTEGLPCSEDFVTPKSVKVSVRFQRVVVSIVEVEIEVEARDDLFPLLFELPATDYTATQLNRLIEASDDLADLVEQAREIQSLADRDAGSPETSYDVLGFKRK